MNVVIVQVYVNSIYIYFNIFIFDKDLLLSLQMVESQQVIMKKLAQMKKILKYVSFQTKNLC